MKTLELLVVRRWLYDNESIGRLYINGRKFCYTLEDEVRKGEKVYGETAIPYGSYPVEISHSPKFGRPMPAILDVPNFSGIRIHTGNTDDDTAGCLLVGYQRGERSISESTAAFRDLYAILEQAQNSGREIRIRFVSWERRALFVALVVVIIVIIAYLLLQWAINNNQK